nr:hypothetical protein [Alicyclobacillus acidocaldarius]
MSKSILFVEGGHASRTVWLENDWALRTNGIFGSSSGECFAILSPDGSWAKMFRGSCQLMLDGSLEPYCRTWPKWGLMYDGACMEHVTWVRHIDETECSYWPTPQARDYRKGDTFESVRAKRKRDKEWSPNLNDVILWGTPKSSEHKGSSPYGSPSWCRDLRRYNLKAQVMNPDALGQLNPDWVECLMGLPVGWTDIDKENEELRVVPWPAGYGEEQYEWEPPRTTTTRRHRVKRLKALGNAVVPAQIAPVFAELVRLENERQQN